MSLESVQRLLAEMLRDPALVDDMPEVARNACAGGASLASAVISCAAYLENPLTGRPALRRCMERIIALQRGAPDGLRRLRETEPMLDEAAHQGAPLLAFASGFGFVETSQVPRLMWWAEQLAAQCTREGGWLLRDALARWPEPSLNTTGLVALALGGCGVDLLVVERQFLWWKLEPALAAAQQVQIQGLQAVPFLTHQMRYTGPRPAPRQFDFDALAREVGLE